MKKIIKIFYILLNINYVNAVCELPPHIEKFLDNNTQYEIKQLDNSREIIKATIKHNDTFSKKFPDGKIEFSMLFNKDNWSFTKSERVYNNGEDTAYGAHITHYLFNKAKAAYPTLVTDSPTTIIRQSIINHDTYGGWQKLNQ